MAGGPRRARPAGGKDEFVHLSVPDRLKQEAAKAALKEAAKAEIYNKEVRIVTRRYYTTGEIRANRNHSVLGTYFKMRN